MTFMRAMTLISYDWAKRCFGKEHVENGAVRGLRHVEEATEVAQCLGATKEDIIKVIEMVYSRPVGELYKEIGGSFLTLLVLCESHGISADDAVLSEVIRVLSKDQNYFVMRNAEKVNPSNG